MYLLVLWHICKHVLCLHIQAASSIVRGITQEAYNIRTPDFFSNVMISGTMSSLTPRMYPFLVELLLAPLAIIGTAIFRFLIDREVKKVRDCS